MLDLMFFLIILIKQLDNNSKTIPGFSLQNWSIKFNTENATDLRNYCIIRCIYLNELYFIGLVCVCVVVVVVNIIIIIVSIFNYVYL